MGIVVTSPVVHIQANAKPLRFAASRPSSAHPKRLRWNAKPLRFEGKQFGLNVSTSAAGGVRVAFQNTDGSPIEGFRLDDCDEIYGDFLEREVTWRGKPDVRSLSGKPVRLLFEIRDADLYAFQFGD